MKKKFEKTSVKFFFDFTSAKRLYSALGKIGKKVYLAFDMTTGEAMLSDRKSRSSKIMTIKKVALNGNWYMSLRQLLYQSIGLMTKTKAISLYGKKVVEMTKMYKEVDNPHYSSAPSMKLFATPMLEYSKKLINNYGE